MNKKQILTIISVIIFNYSFSQKISAVEEIDTIDISNVKISPIDLEDNDDFSTFEGLKNDKFNDVKVFFAGENHNYRYTNSRNQLKLLKYFNQTYGVNTLILEFGYSNGWLVNKYINSEADSNLLKVLESYTYKEYSDYYQGLRKYNLSLPDTSRITVLGIDVERFNNLSAKILSMLLPSGAPHDSILLSVESIRSLAAYLDSYQNDMIENVKNKDEEVDEDIFKFSLFKPESYYVSSTLFDIIEDYDKHVDLFKEYLGSNYETFNILINELKDKEKYEDYERQPQQHIYREFYMYNKMKKYISEHPNAKFFGQFGRCHVGQEMQDEACSWYVFNSIATRLNNSTLPDFKGKVLTIAYFYKDDDSYDEMLDGAGATRKIINKAFEDGTSGIIEVTSDTTLFGKFANQYNFMIANAIDKEAESEFLDIDDITPYDYSKKNAIFNIYGGPIFFKQNFDNLNNYFVANNYPKYSKPLTYNFGISMGEIGGIMVNYQASFTPEQTLNNTIDTTMARISGSSFTFSEGYDVLKSKYLLIVPTLRFSGATYQIEMLDAPEKINAQLDDFGGRKITTYTNPSFLIGGSIDILLRYKFIGIGSSVGYDFDVSNKKWLNGSGNKIDTSPEFSHSNFFYNVNLFMSFNF